MSKSTPWGVSDYARTQAPGITWHSTPGHGGIELSAARLAAMPASLRSFKPWAGAGWFEEDCDWSIACLAFPEAFEPRSCYYAAQQARSDYFAKNGLQPAYFDTPQWAEVQRKAAEHHEEA